MAAEPGRGPGPAAEILHLRWHPDPARVALLVVTATPLLVWLSGRVEIRAATAFALTLMLGLAVALLRRSHGPRHLGWTQAHPLPRKRLGALLVGGVAFILTGHLLDGWTGPLAAGLLTAALTRLAVGLDRPLNRAARRRAKRHAALSARARADLARASDAILDLGDQTLVARTEAVSARALALLAASADTDRRLDAAARALDAFVGGVTADAAALVAAEETERWRDARRRYRARLDDHAARLDADVRRIAADLGRSRTDIEADLILARMPAGRR